MERIMLEQAKALVLRHHDEVWSRGNIDAVDEIFAPDFVGHHPGQPDWVGPDAVKHAVVNARTTFPDFAEHVEDVIVEGDRVVTRFTASGTHLGPYRGLAPTGRSMQMAEMALFRIAGNRIVEKWGLMDRLGMLDLLGIGPAHGPRLDLLYEITMDAVVEDMGRTPAGHRRFVKVTGGTFTGPKMRGTVLPGGGDWVLEHPDGTRALDVRIMLRTHDGDLIFAHYPGRFHGQPDVMSRLTRGEDVDPSEYYFRVAPLFETASEKYDWLKLAIGVGRRASQQVSYRVYAVC
jgi:predicted ester cyclase